MSSRVEVLRARLVKLTELAEELHKETDPRRIDMYIDALGREARKARANLYEQDSVVR